MLLLLLLLLLKSVDCDDDVARLSVSTLGRVDPKSELGRSQYVAVGTSWTSLFFC